MKVLTIGDVHGRDEWKFHTHGSPYEYAQWEKAVSEGASVDSDEWKDFPYRALDKIVFVGDYVDAFDKTNLQILKNLQDILFLKKNLPIVELLLGNHDVQYIVPDCRCSGYRPEIKFDLYKMFNDNIDMFNLAYEFTTESNESWLWTHAGVSDGWYREFLYFFKSEKHFRFRSLISEFLEENPDRKVAEILNFSWKLRMHQLQAVDYSSGGSSYYAGPLWVREKLNKWPLEGYNQVFGHTPQKKLKVVEHEINEKKIKHYCVDYLDKPEEQPLILEL